MFKKIFLVIFISLFIVSCGVNNKEDFVLEEKQIIKQEVDQKLEQEMEQKLKKIEEEMFKELEEETYKYEEQVAKESIKQVKNYTMEKVASYNSIEKCRTIIKWKVYDITSFFGNHPGWDENLKKLCWIDWTELFIEQHSGNEKVFTKLETMYKWELAK